METFVRKSLTLDFRVAPRVCDFPAAQWLGGATVLAEVVARFFNWNAGTSLVALFFGFGLARLLRHEYMHKAPVVFGVVLLARCVGLSAWVFAPIATLGSYFAVKVGQT